MSSNKKSNDPFAPWDQDAHARDMERTDTFNRMVEEVAQHPGGLRKQLEALANTDNAEVIAALAAAGVTSPRVPQRFYLSDGRKAAVWADDSGWRSAAIFNGEQINFSAATRDEVLMLPEKHLQQNSGPHFKEIDEGQRLNIVRLAQNGDWQTAIGTYMYFVLGDQVTDQHPEEIASNPKYLPVMNAAVYFVWRHMNNSYVATPEAEAALAKYVGDRPLTMALCSAWWLAYQERAAQAPVSENVRQPDPTADEIRASLETMSEAELGKLRLQSLRRRAHAIRQAANSGLPAMSGTKS